MCKEVINLPIKSSKANYVSTFEPLTLSSLRLYVRMRFPAFLAWKIEYEKPFIRYQLVEEMITRFQNLVI
jgi:hypothetical protein